MDGDVEAQLSHFKKAQLSDKQAGVLTSPLNLPGFQLDTNPHRMLLMKNRRRRGDYKHISELKSPKYSFLLPVFTP